MRMVVEIDFIVKLGGSAITNKDVFETLNVDGLNAAADVLAECFHLDLRFIVAHGAGSYGHQSAKSYDVADGYKSKKTADEARKVKLGLAITRQSVLKLNQLVVGSLVSRGVPALGISPCPSWRKRGVVVTTDCCDEVERLVVDGLVPVIHGDVVVDDDAGCAILSADTILEVVCAKLSVKRAVFVMDCRGIYTRPPEMPEAKLIPVVHVDDDGRVSDSLEMSSTHDDATGGLALKLKSSVNIVRASRGRVRLLLCSLDGSAFMDACVHGRWQSDSVGTVVTLVK